MSTPLVRARSLLEDLGAATLPHPGGTLLAHLWRVQSRLADWGARPALRLAGLCHACYGTDGFPTALLPLDRRAELAWVVGAEAESTASRAVPTPRTPGCAATWPSSPPPTNSTWPTTTPPSVRGTAPVCSPSSTASGRC